MKKVESLFDRYMKQWSDGRPQGAHNVPRRGQMREAGVTGKRTFKELVTVKSDVLSNENKQGGDDLRQFEITSQNLEDNASII